MFKVLLSKDSAYSEKVVLKDITFFNEKLPNILYNHAYPEKGIIYVGNKERHIILNFLTNKSEVLPSKPVFITLNDMRLSNKEIF